MLSICSTYFLFISVIDSFKNCIGCHDLRSLGLVFFLLYLNFISFSLMDITWI